MPEIISTAPASGEDAQVESSESSGDSQATTHRIGVEPETSTASQTNGDASAPEAKAPHKPKSHYQRVKEQNQLFKQREAALKAREEQIAEAERAKQAPKKEPYTAAEIKEYRQAWENEGRFDLVEKADKEIARLEKLEADQIAASKKTIELPRYGTKEHRERWEAGEREIQKENPDFMKPNTRLDSMIRKVMQSPYGETARDHPDGIWAVYSEAQKELLKEDNQSLRGKIQQLENELKRLTGLTSIGGGAPGRISGGRVENLKDFSKLSSADMLKHLKSSTGKGGMPWL